MPISPFEIKIVKTEVILSRWEEIEQALLAAFDNASFIEAGHSITRPIDHTMATAWAIPVAHILVLDLDDQIIGGVFCIPIDRRDGETSCDIGWMFIAPQVPKFARPLMLGRMVAKVCEIARLIGFTRIVTQMGTKAGALVLSQRYGFIDISTADQPNRWELRLDTASHQPRS